MDLSTKILIVFVTVVLIGAGVAIYFYIDRLNWFTTECYAQGGDHVEANRGMACWDTNAGKRIFLKGP